MKAQFPSLLSLVAGIGLCSLAQTSLAQTENTFSATTSHSTFGVRLNPTIFRVQENEDYLLPNDQFKIGIASAFQFEYLVGSKRNYGIRVSLEAAQRNGRYTFGLEKTVRREFLLSLPIEFVLREPVNEHWQMSASVGGQYSELVQRYSYRLDPATGKTIRQEYDWLYGIPGFVGSAGLVKSGKLEQQFGFRYCRELGSFSQRVGSDRGPFLKYEYYGLYYSLALFGR